MRCHLWVLTLDICSDSITIVLYVLSYFIGLHYNSTWLYSHKALHSSRVSYGVSLWVNSLINILHVSSSLCMWYDVKIDCEILIWCIMRYIIFNEIPLYYQLNHYEQPLIKFLLKMKKKTKKVFVINTFCSGSYELSCSFFSFFQLKNSLKRCIVLRRYEIKSLIAMYWMVSLLSVHIKKSWYFIFALQFRYKSYRNYYCGVMDWLD